ncbi:MAG: DNA-binding domain-containing protein [Pseudomonadota bacterium]
MAEPVSQTSFRQALLDAKRPAPDGLTDGEGRPAGRRFDVYRNNVAVSLIEALGDSFPAIAKLLGSENFRNVAGLYIRQNPPRSPLMMQYGESFAGFLADFPPLAHLPYLSDVARLEQALREAYHAADAAPIEAQELGRVSADALAGLRLTLAPSLHVLSSDYPVHAIWAYNMEPGSPKPEPVAQSVLITRPEFDPVPTAISAGDAAFIEAIGTGAPLGVAAERGTDIQPDFDLTHALGLLLRGGAITSLIPGD